MPLCRPCGCLRVLLCSKERAGGGAGGAGLVTCVCLAGPWAGCLVEEESEGMSWVPGFLVWFGRTKKSWWALQRLVWWGLVSWHRTSTGWLREPFQKAAGVFSVGGYGSREGGRGSTGNWKWGLNLRNSPFKLSPFFSCIQTQLMYVHHRKMQKLENRHCSCSSHPEIISVPSLLPVIARGTEKMEFSERLIAEWLTSSVTTLHFCHTSETLL